MELTRSGVVASVVVLAVVVTCVRLGLWQLDRRDQRLERNSAIAERLATAPAELTAPPGDTAGLTHRTVVARGEYDHDRSFVLIGRSLRGVPGVHLFTPLRLGQGAILVNRGWLAAPDAATVDLSAVSRPGRADVRGVLMPYPDIPGQDDGGEFQPRRHRLDGAAVRAQYPYDVAPLYVQATDTDPAGPAPGPRQAADVAAADPIPLGPPALDAGPHFSYAVQWFSFAAIFLVGWIALAVRRGRPRASAG